MRRPPAILIFLALCSTAAANPADAPVIEFNRDIRPILADNCFDQVVVCGEGRSYLTALVVPHWANLRRALQAEGITARADGEQALARDAGVRALLQRRIDAALRDVSSFEQVRKIAVLPQAFTVAGEELTVSLKLRRNVIQAKYGKELEALYRE